MAIRTRSVVLNLAIGSDHVLATYSSGDPIINDHGACPNRSEDVNQLQVQTGSSVNTSLTNGLISGISGQINGQPIPSATGRLRCNSASADCQTVKGTSLDHTGLWHYLNGACPGTDTHAGMKGCLDGWSSGVIFDSSIGDNPRFVAVPIFTTQPNAPGNYLIDHFAPVWLETIYTNCNANRCTTVHSPGEAGPVGACPNPITPGITNCGWNVNGNYSVEALTAFELDLGMLPTSITDFFRGRRSIAN